MGRPYTVIIYKVMRRPELVKSGFETVNRLSTHYGIRQTVSDIQLYVKNNVMQAGTRFTYPRGMEGWVDLVDLIAHCAPAGSRTSDLSVTSSTPNRCTTKTTLTTTVTEHTVTDEMAVTYKDARWLRSFPSLTRLGLRMQCMVNQFRISVIID